MAHTFWMGCKADSASCKWQKDCFNFVGVDRGEYRVWFVGLLVFHMCCGTAESGVRDFNKCLNIFLLTGPRVRSFLVKSSTGSGYTNEPTRCIFLFHLWLEPNQAAGKGKGT